MKTLSAIALAAATFQAAACGLGGGPHSHFGAAHPGSIDVALATHDLARSGHIASLAPVTPESGRQRAEPLVHALAARWPDARQPVAMLLVESGLWVRWLRTDGRLELATDVGGHVAGDAIVITSEAVLGALLAGRLSVGEALDARALRPTSIDQVQTWVSVFAQH